ncbi:Protein of unknown function [Anaerobranca californiensis DSM 14826]|jgi:uncharacterized protein YrzB (UPF0473 family)|uniref:Uncharacterized protein n=1 Tax=Anaerobranca californiensis DSM 14826 TaxID=1120989 RepID=A0A1M6LD23_9FIRM|nr:DUF1292 domain-containing protein [Anaerobranca californiensis]SHJ69141.1 Protein of unknown function [Anaerobranca californiensis DSM 14826]
MYNEEEVKIVLVDEDGNEHSFVEYERIIFEDDREFALLLAVDELDDDDAELYVFEVTVDENGEEHFTAVEDPQIIEEVEDAYHAIIEYEEENEDLE